MGNVFIFTLRLFCFLIINSQVFRMEFPSMTESDLLHRTQCCLIVAIGRTQLSCGPEGFGSTRLFVHILGSDL